VLAKTFGVARSEGGSAISLFVYDLDLLVDDLSGEPIGVGVIMLAPYLIFYRFEKPARQVEMLRFWHAARNPLSLEL
jgi:hypothetical protein